MFILRPFSYNIMYSKYTTFYSSTYFMMLLWSYHWWFGYPFVMFPMQERIATHDTFQDTIVVIASKSGIHVQTKVFHFFPCHTRKWIDIVITRDNFQTLTNIVIADPTCTNLVQHTSITTAHAGTIAVQNKARSYTKWTSRNDFIPLAMETYNCLHFCFDYFLTSCVHACRTCH